MPPRYAYWTIIAGGLPTAFRAADRDELLPTFHRIKEKHPDAEMKWFARGKLWASPEDAQRHLHERRQAPSGSRGREARGKDWRPGGEHRDPRQPFKDAKKQQNQERRQRRWDLKHRDEGPGARVREERSAARGPRPRDGKPGSGKPPAGARRRPATDVKSTGDRPFRPRENNRRASARPRPSPRPAPHGDKLRDEIPRRPFKPAHGHGRSAPGRAAPKERGHWEERTPPQQPRPPRPEREPRPDAEPGPEPPPHPDEPAVPPSEPPERGQKR